MPYRRASSSPVSPMICPDNEHVNPSRYIASTKVKLPMRWPHRASSASTRYGIRLIDSIPPATTTSASPSMIACAPDAIDCIPEAHALLIVYAGTSSGSPVRRPTCRAGLGPEPACLACPMSTSSTFDPSTPARSSTALTATAPSSAGWTFRNAPPYRPIGVLAAPTMTTSEAITG